MRRRTLCGVQKKRPCSVRVINKKISCLHKYFDNTIQSDRHTHIYQHSRLKLIPAVKRNKSNGEFTGWLP